MYVYIYVFFRVACLLAYMYMCKHIHKKIICLYLSVNECFLYKVLYVASKKHQKTNKQTKNELLDLMY